MRYYIIAGEASGDLHASNLIKALLLQDKNAIFRFWGGDLMQEATGGIAPIKHYKELAFMGFVEVVLNLPTIIRNLHFCKKDVAQWKPDAVILVDYPGFNLRIAKFTHQLPNCKNLYYISPQVWAWKSSRVQKMKRYLDALYVILPFEATYYAQHHNWKVHYVGHPLLDAVNNFKQQYTALPSLPSSNPIIALLPGSRKQEIKRIFPVMLQLISQFPDYQFVVAAAPSLPLAFYKTFFNNTATNVHIVHNRTYQVLQHAEAALVTSGTATLEAALFKVPQVVCYKGNSISVRIAKWLVKVPYISLVNLILNKEAVQELIQENYTVDKLAKALVNVLPNGERHAALQEDYHALQEILGKHKASKRTAELIYKATQTNYK